MPQPVSCSCPLCAEAEREALGLASTAEVPRRLAGILPLVHRRAARNARLYPNAVPRQGGAGSTHTGTRRPRYNWTQINDWLEGRTGTERCGHCGEPMDDCECITCACGHMVSEARGSLTQCSECEQCSECCECRYCEGCENTYRTSTGQWCGDCDRCAECCECGDRAPGRDSDGRMHGTPSARYPRHVGVEIECGTGGSKYEALNEALNQWGAAAHGDGSIQLSHPLEVATAPAQGESFVKQIDQICAGLKKCKAKVDTSCGLHVHVSARDLTSAQVLGLVRLYARVEPALYSIVAASRRDNHYSKMWGASFEMGEVFDKGTVSERFDRLEATLYGSKSSARSIKEAPYKHDCRYHGLNLNSLLLYGTIEFRLHHGTVDPVKIKMWAAVCSALMQYAATHTEREVARLAGSSWDVLMKVLRGDAEVVAWVKERRERFAAANRYERGLSEIEPARPADAERSE